MTTKTKVPWPRPGHPMTRADLYRLPNDGRRYELIDGVLVVSPSPGTRHQRAVVRLTVVIAGSCPDEFEMFPAPLDINVVEDTVLRPDALVVRRDRVGQHDLLGMPELVVEVQSPSTRLLDLELKRSRYEDAGCPSYWVIDPDVPSIVAWDLIDGRYVEAGRAEGDMELALTKPYPIVLNPARLAD